MATIHILIVICIFAGLLLLNMPIYIALLASSIYLQVFVNNMPATNIVAGMYEGLSKPTLMAVPLYIFAGSIIANTTLGERLIYVFDVVFQRFKSGMAVACLAANAFFGAISGSAPAATATFGKITFKPLGERYDEILATGLITSSGALSSIIPPSIAMILYAIAAEVSVAKLFLTGIIPGLFIVVIVAIYLSFRCRKAQRGSFAKVSEMLSALKKGLPVLVLPIIVLGGIYSGFFTPTEAGAVAAVYSMFIGVFVLRDIRAASFIKIIRDAAITTSQIFIIVAVGTTFAQAMTTAQFHSTISKAFGDLNLVAFLLLVNVILLVAGCFLDGASAILIFAPLVIPISNTLGVDPLHLGIIFVVNLAIGCFTPPIGLNIFVSQSVLGKNMGYISRSALPFLACYIIGLAFITYIPQLSLWILQW